jgi:hypothetical protein
MYQQEVEEVMAGKVVKICATNDASFFALSEDGELSARNGNVWSPVINGQIRDICANDEYAYALYMSGEMFEKHWRRRLGANPASTRTSSAAATSCGDLREQDQFFCALRERANIREDRQQLESYPFPLGARDR